MIVVHHVVLALAVAALGGAGLRLAGRVGAAGLELAVAAAPLAAAAAVLWSLALGVVDLGGSTIALAAGAAATWLAARLLLPDPRVREQLAAWWADAGVRGKAGAGGMLALALALCIWQLRHPHLDLDGTVYHLGLPGAWVHNGTPGSIVGIVDGMPVANYPITYEVLISWLLGLSRSWVVASIITPAFALLLATALWTALRSLDVPKLVATLAAIALVTLPLSARQFGGPLNDLPATTWLACTAALVALSVRGPRPLLLVPAVISAGLAVGTKTTPVLLGALALGFAIWHHRRALRSIAMPLAAATFVGFLVCAIWPIRNLIDHGSPLWPFVSTSFGDPLPPKIQALDHSFIEHPAAVLRGRTGAYAEILGGALLLYPAALLLGFVSRSRVAIAVTLAAAAALVLWMNAPYTGIDDSTGLAITTTRYLLPTLLAATAALALSARGDRPRMRAVAVAVFVVTIAISLVLDARIGFPFLPSIPTIVLPALAGAGLAFLVARRRLPAVAWAAPLLAILAGLALSTAAPGYVERHAQTFGYPGYIDLFAALRAQPGYEDDTRPVAMGPYTFAVAGGDDLAHPVSLVPNTEPCAAVRADARRGWLVVVRIDEPESHRLQACMRSVRPVAHLTQYDLYGPGA